MKCVYVPSPPESVPLGLGLAASFGWLCAVFIKQLKEDRPAFLEVACRFGLQVRTGLLVETQVLAAVRFQWPTAQQVRNPVGCDEPFVVREVAYAPVELSEPRVQIQECFLSPLKKF